MSPVTDIKRLKDIMARNAEKFRVAALPRIDPETGRENPFVLVDHNDHDIKFLLEQIAALQAEIFTLEEMLDDDDDFTEDEDDQP